MVAFGIWKKIKNGIKKVAKWTNDKIVKPIVKPVLNATKKFIPFGEVISDTVEAVSDGIDGNWGTAKKVATSQFNQRIAPRLRPG